MLNEGVTAPDFALPDETGQTFKLSAYKGSVVVVYFYPKDDTPGCTTEAKNFSALADAFKAAGSVVIGISPDSSQSHHKFKAKHGLAVTLIADQDRAAATAYGVWVEKSMYGKTYMGVERSTFLVGAAGKIRKIWRKVKVPGHADDVLAAVKALKG